MTLPRAPVASSGATPPPGEGSPGVSCSIGRGLTARWPHPAPINRVIIRSRDPPRGVPIHGRFAVGSHPIGSRLMSSTHISPTPVSPMIRKSRAIVVASHSARTTFSNSVQRPTASSGCSKLPERTRHDVGVSLYWASRIRHSPSVPAAIRYQNRRRSLPP